jgi:hypothetical protein
MSYIDWQNALYSPARKGLILPARRCLGKTWCDKASQTLNRWKSQYTLKRRQHEHTLRK